MHWYSPKYSNMSVYSVGFISVILRNVIYPLLFFLIRLPVFDHLKPRTVDSLNLLLRFSWKQHTNAEIETEMDLAMPLLIIFLSFIVQTCDLFWKAKREIGFSNGWPSGQFVSSSLRRSTSLGQHCCGVG